VERRRGFAVLVEPLIRADSSRAVVERRHGCRSPTTDKTDINSEELEKL
jgi:hypothetical protein